MNRHRIRRTLASVTIAAAVAGVTDRTQAALWARDNLSH
jgi:hypothetical protein